ncbi:MAG: hypothetical protein OEZ68_03830 [Gammaproteobacteria bacterium]|nr:hypothetical protein [Gammaproteobacteria bacterium]MDH5799915.1 hypothetical protein [Gammaproteobacteria bacterium]
MPFIHIKSLPYAQPKPMHAILPALCRDFSQALAIPLEHVHATWEYFQAGHFCKGDDAPLLQPDSPHSVLVDLLTPDFNDADTVVRMLSSIAHSLERHAAVPLNKIFIIHREAASGSVFDDGVIASW